MLSEPVHGISNGGLCATSNALDQPAHARSLIRAFACQLSVMRLLGCCLGVVWVLCLGGLCGLVWVCVCRNATLLEVTCHSSRFYYPILLYICALEIFAVKTTSLSKVLLLFFAFSFLGPPYMSTGCDYFAT